METPKRTARTRKPKPVEKILGDLGAHDLGHVIRFSDQEGVLTRVLHEGSPEGPRPTYLTIQTDGLTGSMTGRFDHDLPVTVMPIPPQRLVAPDSHQTGDGIVE